MLAFYLSLIETEEDKSKFQLVYEQYSRLMKYVAVNVLNNETLAEDAVQNSFLKIINNLDCIEDVYSHKTKSFIVLVTKRTSIDMGRREALRQHYDMESIKEPRISNSHIYENVEIKEIVEKIKMLPEKYRDILELKISHGLNEREMSEILGISHEAARKRMQRAREALAELLNN